MFFLFPISPWWHVIIITSLKTPFSKKPLNHSRNLDFLRKIFCVLHTTRSDKFKFFEPIEGRFSFHVLFSTQVETQSNQMRCDGGKSNEWENKENTQSGRRRRKISSYVHSIFSLSPPKRVEKSVHICKRQAATTTRKRSQSSVNHHRHHPCVPMNTKLNINKYNRKRFSVLRDTQRCCCLPAVPKRKIKCNKFPHIFEFVWFCEQFSIQLQRALFLFRAAQWLL